MAASTYTVQVVNRNKSFQVKAGDNLLSGLEKSCCDAIDIGCRGGGCGLCKVKILAGNYQTKVMSKRHICEHQAANGYALACRLLPESDLVVESDHFKKSWPKRLVLQK